ncbi:hypothetical protein [Kitasatospora aureofaciens]|uniref:hypothetical protein n=1 Tax=Kitasatospora aureofaciens TaxID=1894 RepID=UPI0036F475A4
MGAELVGTAAAALGQAAGMASDSPRLLRADAARNAEKIILAAREVFTEQGPDAHPPSAPRPTIDHRAAAR